MRAGVAFVVQHHPSRPAYLARLLASLDAPAAICVDPDPDGRRSAWRTYRLCLETAIDMGYEHTVTLQDDAVCVPGFATAAVTAAEDHPDSLLTFFHSRQRMKPRTRMYEALNARQPYFAVPWGIHVHTVALMWPTKLIPDFLHWIDHERKGRSDHVADDQLTGDWVTKRRNLAYATAPCLVEHPLDSDSLFGRRAGMYRCAISLAEHCDDWLALRSPFTADTLAASR